jgi:predicted transcriptional regulator
MNISDAEWEVMQVVWRRRSVTAAEVIEALVPRTGWSHRTVRTLLARLVDKGVLAVEQEGHRYRYRPLVSRTRCDMVQLTANIPESELREVRVFAEENVNIVFLELNRK